MGAKRKEKDNRSERQKDLAYERENLSVGVPVPTGKVKQETKGEKYEGRGKRRV